MTPCPDLVRRAQADRSPESLGALVAAVQADVFHFLARHLRHDADAEDATQETFRQALRTLPSLRDPAAFPGWIHRIALRVSQDVVRGRAARKRLAEEVSRRVSEGGGAAMSDIEKTETRSAVRAAVEGLDEELRTTVVLRYEQGLSYAEIARAMECPEGTVGKRLHTAHGRLHKTLGGVAIALALLERELAAEPRVPVKARLARALEEIARTSSIESPRPGGGRASTKILAGVLAIAVVFCVLWRWRTHEPATAQNTGPSLAKTSAGPGVSATSGPGGAKPSPPPEKGHAAKDPVESRPAHATLSGRVTDAATGEPVPGAIVRGREFIGTLTTTRREEFFETTTDPRGEYAVEVAPCQYDLEVFASGFVPLQGAARLRSATAWANMPGDGPDDPAAGPASREFRFTIAADAVVRRDVAMTAAAGIGGVVTDTGGLPLEHAVVTFERHGVEGPAGSMWTQYDNDDSGHRNVTTDVTGRFRLGGLFPGGTVTLVAVHAGKRPLRVEVPVSGRPADVTLMLEAGCALSGVVTDAHGLPVEGAVLAYADPLDKHGEVHSEKAAANGTFLIVDPPGPPAWLAAWAPGHGWSAVSLDGADLARLRIALPDPGLPLKGVLHDEAGHPVAGARIVVSSLHRLSDPGRGVMVFPTGFSGFSIGPGEIGVHLPADVKGPETTTDEKGEFALDGLPLGPDLRADVMVMARGYLRHSSVVSDTRWLDMTLKAGDMEDADDGK